ncbi:hypothetical protein [Kribbia dieselivorans]|uniref:hypothetical protein n=1 Tax=Kribbia dieselivorans TaxID=331526 RepID=UPI0008397251|nr:hypothetical protein [Kribbia dieselivorans]
MPEVTQTPEHADATAGPSDAPAVTNDDQTAGRSDAPAAANDDQLITYPSAQFPGPPSVSVQIPSDWAPVRVLGAHMAARRVDTDSSFAPNIVVRGYVRDDAFTLADAIDELREHVEGLPDGQVDAPFDIEIGDAPFVGCNVSWHDPELGQVVQVHLFTAAARSKRIDVVQVTGSVCGDGAVDDYATLRGILESVAVTR